jgi:polyferredoxin
VRDLRDPTPVRRALDFGPFQFVLVLPTAAAVAVVLISTAVGIEHPSANFGLVFTWVVWWGGLLLSVVIAGRAWCLVCPVGAAGEWLQRLSFWWRSAATAGLGLRWPRRLRNLWLATTLFVAFVFLDNGYGISNSPRMTAGLIVVLVLAAAWTHLVFERRAFCRYLCPLTALIGLGALVSMLELGRRDPETCRVRCATKDCYRGNARRWGCPMEEFPGGEAQVKVHCILCTECVKSCRCDNIALRLGAPGRDLWRLRRPRLDGAVAAMVIVAMATVVPLLTVAFLGDIRRLFVGVLPAGAPPNDLPRLAAIGLLFVIGLGAGVALLYGASRLSRHVAGEPAVTTRTLFTRYAYALIPVGLARLIADLLDHALRTWGALWVVTRALLFDFPLNRVMPGRASVVHLLGPVAAYGLQVGVLLGGLLLTVYAMDRISKRVFADRAAAFASFVPVAGLGLLLTLVSVWTLGIALP